MCVFDYACVYVSMCIWKQIKKNDILNMKWRVLQITVFKYLIYLSNCNKQVFKINFKPLLKWTFDQNQCCRFWNDEQLSCSKFLELPHKNGRKIWISKCRGHFQMHSSFKFYLSNKVSNEKCLKRKL